MTGHLLGMAGRLLRMTGRLLVMAGRLLRMTGRLFGMTGGREQFCYRLHPSARVGMTDVALLNRWPELKRP